MSTPSRPYFANGQVLQSPPFHARVRGFFDSLYMIFGLYLVSLFSFDPYTAAEASSFNIRNKSTSRPRLGGGGSGPKKGPGGGGPGSGGKGPGSGGGGSGGKKFGTVDDVRGPECKSCQ